MNVVVLLLALLMPLVAWLSNTGGLPGADVAATIALVLAALVVFTALAACRNGWRTQPGRHTG